MHAASVHPEPGSNSLIIVYILDISAKLHIRVDPLYYFFKELLVFLNSKEFFGAFLCLSRCSIFKEHSIGFLRSPDVSFAIISHVFIIVKTFLSKKSFFDKKLFNI